MPSRPLVKAVDCHLPTTQESTFDVLDPDPEVLDPAGEAPGEAAEAPELPGEESGAPPATAEGLGDAPERPPIDVLRESYPDIRVAEAGLIDAGPVITGGGVSLCIDTTLHILARVAGEDVANETARILEYTRARRANSVDFPPVVKRGG